jgi:hypothetical protein
MSDVAGEAISWISRNSKEPAVNCDDLGPKLFGKWLDKRRGAAAQFAFFTPWGPKYTYKEKGTGIGEPERLTLDELNGIFRFFNNELGIPIKWYVLLADTYGTQINGLPDPVVNSYFSNLEQEISNMPGFETKWWSRVKDCDRYVELEKQVSGNLFDYVTPEIFANNIEKSRKFGGDESNAKAYSVERVVEGLLIEEMYSPLKVSLVASKNDVLDGPLRRIYVVENRKPWLK